jgi:DinB superfamily
MTQIELMTQTAIQSWKLIIGRIDQGLSAASDEDWQTAVAPGRNRVSYLIGHLTAVHDRLFPLLGLGERIHPELDKDFLDNPDGPNADKTSGNDLRKAWTEVNHKLLTAFESLRPEQWLERHTAVSEEDFGKDPLRNRLAVLLSRTSHAAFHGGQMRLTQRT